ncbi:UNVERIFIED_CONTAM: hypothetical protein FKN15_027753 [Acipenser sinensis]
MEDGKFEGGIEEPSVMEDSPSEDYSVSVENISMPVYGALGDSVYLHFNTTFNSSVEVEWKQGVYRISKFKNDRMTFSNPYINRTEIFANGTLRLDRTQKNDSGNYSVDVFTTDGISIFKGSMQVYIQEAVSQPVVHSTCLSHGEVLLVCTVDKGDNVSFNWSLDGVPLNTSLAYFSDKDHIVILKKHVSGNLVCIATNQVSTNQSYSVIPNCSEAVSQPVVHSTCLSHGEVLLVCTVDKGDNVSFNWSLDGVPLNTSLAYFSDKDHIVILKKNVTGDLVCIAKNQINEHKSDSVKSNCSEAVSQPVVHSTCLSHGEVLLVCTVDKGDNVSFNWSLDGVPLNTSLAYFSDKDHIVILKKNVTGDLVCIAKNQINEHKSDSVKSNCSGSEPKINPTSTPNLETQFHCTLENGTVIKLSEGKEGETFHFLINKSMIITNYTHGIAFCSLQTCSSNCSGNLTTEPGDARNAEDADDQVYTQVVNKGGKKKSKCKPKEDVTAEHISVPVYGALGDSVYLHFNTTLNSSIHVEWKQGDNRIGVFKNNRPGFKDPYINRTEIFANGTLRLDRTQKNDSGDYSVEVFTTDGTNIFKRSMQVYIQVSVENISMPVYGALGDSVYLHFNTTFNSSVEVEWKQGVYRISKFKNDRMAFSNPYINRAEIFANGTLRLDRTQKNDSGDYSVKVFTTDGTNIFKRSMQVYIQEAVSKPVVHSTCLSHGEVLLVCTVDKGDNASFNWSLDGVLLNTSLAYFSDEEHVVILKKHVSGNLVCIATNQVSTNQSDSVIPNCSEAVSQPVVHSTCLSHGEVLLVCTVDKGDNASFNWSLDGVPLNTSLAYFSDKEHIIILKKNVTGDLVCIAKNQINEEKSDSVKSNCSVTAENISVPVYGALGDSVYLHLNTTLNSSVHVEWKQGDNRIGVFKNNRPGFKDPYINRTEIFANGTLRLDRTQKNDSGDYSVDVFNTDGTNIFKGSMQVYIQEAVSQPVVHSTCLSHGEVLLVCTVDKGDNALFNWSLDGVPLNPSLAYFSDEEYVVILKKHVSDDQLYTQVVKKGGKKKSKGKPKEDNDQLYTQVVKKGGKKKSKCKPKEDSELVYAQVVIKEDKKKPIHDESVDYDEDKEKDKNNQQQDDSVVYAAINKRRNI